MGERRVAYTTLKMAVLAPIPRMSARRATEVKPGFLSSSRRPKRTLRAKLAMLAPSSSQDCHPLKFLDVPLAQLSRSDVQNTLGERKSSLGTALVVVWGPGPGRGGVR